jgi:hypothetical protein
MYDMGVVTDFLVAKLARFLAGKKKWPSNARFDGHSKNREG